MRHIPKKRFGQNFLRDPDIIRSCVDAIRPQPDDVMVEIGPGLGALTQPLLRTLNHLHAVELDRDIVSWMQGHYPENKITIHNVDALKFDFSTLADPAKPGEKVRVVGNLPYNISTPILFHLLESVQHISDMHFMLQKEVVERMVATPSTPEYGRLSVMLQYRLHMDYLFTVPAAAFDPAPKVESAFVRAIPHAAPPYPAGDEALFARVVMAAFGQRRKTLRNTLKGLLDDAGFAALEIGSGLRAENLSVEQFVAIANHLA
ncbi:ribosomal RNA small subunit methyltransferase A [mine drainage metagenome]|uniref:Ribosomal RNA small subunit methyltransferase A n=1 Tax=mine drainage metagenome TaxID=410659 RepID=A0A1J5QST1_9ZZZZ